MAGGTWGYLEVLGGTWGYMGVVGGRWRCKLGSASVSKTFAPELESGLKKAQKGPSFSQWPFQIFYCKSLWSPLLFSNFAENE